MSDFEQWCVDTYGKPSGSLCLLNGEDLAKSYQAAKQSMQGEALQLPEGDREAIEAFMMDHFSDKTFRNYIRKTLAGDFAYQLANALRKLYTHAPDSAARIAEQDAEIARLKMAIEYDNADDDAEWQPPHPIFQLAQERDNFMNRVTELQKELEEARKENRDLVLAGLDHMKHGIKLMGFHHQAKDFAELKKYLEENVARIDASLNIKGGAE